VTSPRYIDHRYAPNGNWTCIGRPDDVHKTLVTESGALLYEFADSAPNRGGYWFDRVFSFGLRISETPESVTQSTESALLPIVRTRFEYSSLALELVTFGHNGQNGRTDVVLWTVTTKSPSESVDTAVWVEGQILGRVLAFEDGLTRSNKVNSVNASHRRIPTDYVSPGVSYGPPPTGDAEESLAFVSVPQALSMEPDSQFGPSPRVGTDLFTARPGESVSGAFVFALDDTDVDHVDFDWISKALQSERQFWSDCPVSNTCWRLPDSQVMDMVTASARNIMQARERKDGVPEFQVGPTCYRGLWVVDGHFILEAARYLGHESASSQGIEALKRRVAADGSIAQLPFHLKETAISIGTLIRQCELDDDWEHLDSMWDIISNAVEFIRNMRQASRRAGRSAPEYGLTPPTFGDGGLGDVRAEYTTALWTLVGLKWAAKAAEQLGRQEDAVAIGAEFEDLMKVFRDKAKRDLGILPDGTPYLPMAMPSGGGKHLHDAALQGEIDPYYRINPGTATWALAHAIYPGEVFAPDDPVVENLCHYLEQIDDEEGIPANTGWLPHNAVWNYSASFYAHVWLYAGRPDKAIDYLYAFANHASPTRVWREEQSLRSASHEQIVGDMPHNWASAEFIRLTRHLLVFERCGGLDLLPGLPNEWIISGERIRLENTPTRYGPIDLTLSFGQDGSAELDVGVDAGWSQQPQHVLLHIPAGYECTGIRDEGVAAPGAQVLELAFESQRIAFRRSRRKS
jgi:hypothetical protein